MSQSTLILIACGITFLKTDLKLDYDFCCYFVDNKNLRGFQTVIVKRIQNPSTLSNQKPINPEEEKR